MISHEVCQKCKNYRKPLAYAYTGWSCEFSFDAGGVYGMNIIPKGEVPEHCLYKFEQGVAAGMTNEKP